MQDQPANLYRILVYVFTVFISQLPATTFAQIDSENTTVNDDDWQGPTLRARGRIFGSFESIEAPDEDTRLEDAYFRRADITVRGSLLRDLNYYVKTEFKEGTLDIRDAYLSYDTGPVYLQFGFLDPIDEIITPAYREFMEVSIVEGFPAGNQLGIGILHEAKTGHFLWPQ